MKKDDLKNKVIFQTVDKVYKNILFNSLFFFLKMS